MEKSVKYYLAQKVPFTLSTDDFVDGVSSTKAKLVGNEIAVVSCTDDESLHHELTDKLRSAFRKRGLRWTIQLNYTIPPLFMVDNDDGERRRDARDNTEFHLTFSEDDASLKEIFGEFASLQVEVFEVLVPSSGRQLYGFTTQEMPVTASVEMFGSGDDILEFKDDTSSAAIHQILREGEGYEEITGKMNLIVIYKRHGDHVEDCAKMAKRMLEEELAPDAVIVPGNNSAEVKCHRSFLAAQSDVFRSMFGTDMQEAKTHRIEMPDMSEEGVRAFLAYLYYWDVSKAEESCGVTLELLEAGHKYNVGSLEKAMRNLLLFKPEAWYYVEMVVKLFLFVRNLEAEWEPLKRKAVMVMKKKFANLENSGTFQDLFENHPRAAMDFCRYSISVPSIRS